MTIHDFLKKVSVLLIIVDFYVFTWPIFWVWGFAGFYSWFVNLGSKWIFFYINIESFDLVVAFIINYKNLYDAFGKGIAINWWQLGKPQSNWNSSKRLFKINLSKIVWEWIEKCLRKQVKVGSVISFVGKA